MRNAIETDYSPLSLLAVTSLVLGVISVLGLFFPMITLLAIPGVLFGIAALVAMRRYELHGRNLARLGICLSLVFGILAPVSYEIRFYSEALPGYKRVNFLEIMQDRKNSESHFAALVGQNVCLKGYGLLRSRNSELNAFPLSYHRRSSGFGGKDNPEEIVLVILPEGKIWEWQHEAIAVSGTLVRNPAAKNNPDVPKFLLEQSAVIEARTWDGLLRSGGGGRGGC